MSLIKKLDANLLNLAWSLWTELGVAGNDRHHQDVLIPIEELLIITSLLSEIDPRLRDESLDWCSQFHQFISISRLKSLMKDFEEPVKVSFSRYASSFNHCAEANWPVLMEVSPVNIHLSHKSTLRAQKSSALLNIRARAIFGTGARADLVTFFLLHPHTECSISDMGIIGYSKRNLAAVLEDLHVGKLVERLIKGNQHRYRLKKNSSLFQMLSPIPKYVPWNLIFKVLLSLRARIQSIENYSESTQVVELRNWLKEQEQNLQQLELAPPLFHNDFSAYLASLSQWVLEWTSLLAKGQAKI